MRSVVDNLSARLSKSTLGLSLIMFALKAVPVLIIVVLLLPTNTAAQLAQDEWEKLVCAMFTGAKLSNGNGGLIVQGHIRTILTTYHSSPDFLIQSNFKYWPTVTALYQENHQGDIIVEQGVTVLASDTCRDHPEQQLVKKDTEYLRSVHSIGLNYSPCIIRSCTNAIIARYREEEIPKPVIHFCQVHKYDLTDKKQNGMKGIKLLIENGFNLKVWETIRMLHYLLEHAPTDELKHELQQAYENATLALFYRDFDTQALIKRARSEVRDEQIAKRRAATQKGVAAMTEQLDKTHINQTDDDEEQAYWPGWGNFRRHNDDDDDEPGTGGAASGRGGGGGTYSSSSSSGSSSSDTQRRSSSWRQGATAQHSSGWSLGSDVSYKVSEASSTIHKVCLIVTADVLFD